MECLSALNAQQDSSDAGDEESSDVGAVYVGPYDPTLTMLSKQDNQTKWDLVIIKGGSL